MYPTVIILRGGLSHERDVSIRSGRRVAQALKEAGYETIEADLNSDLIALVKGTPNAVVVPLLHGGVGEDGALREVLALLGVPYVGSTGPASRVTFDKSVAIPVLAEQGIPTPPQVALPHDIFRELGAAALMEMLATRIGFPMMVKPACSGSALGATKVNDLDALPQAMVGAYAYGSVNVIEKFIVGTEIAVTVLDDAEGVRALPPVQIRPESGVYDYASRYTAGETRFVTPADLDVDVTERVLEIAVAVHTGLGLRDISRIDLIVDESGMPVVLEANVAPGMTETSLVPLAIEAAGLTMAQVWAGLVETAAGRGPDRDAL